MKIKIVYSIYVYCWILYPEDIIFAVVHFFLAKKVLISVDGEKGV